ncbi:MAG TPA: hypothetical protein VH684_00700 [Xanthobacteraceae bacterium]|jgi:chromosome segregation ATPase
MTIKAVATKPDGEAVDPLTEKIRDSILGVEHLRTENSRLTDQVKSLETANLQLESQVESLKLTLEQERSERRHYHSLANEIITRLDVVGQTIDDVVKRAEQETYRQRREKSRAETPETEMPNFLKKVEALTNGLAEKPNGFAQQ